MASLKADKPVGTQPAAPVKKEPVKAPTSKQAPKKPEQKPEQKPREPKKASGGKPGPAPTK